MTTSLIRWDPRPDLLRGHLGRLFDEAFRDLLAPLQATADTRLGSWTPAVDIRETEDALVLQAELPGLEKDDLEITIEDHVLTLRGERRLDRDETRESFHRVERAYGQFSRTFQLPTSVRMDGVKAQFANGLLTLELPKVEAAKPHRVEIG